MTNERTVSWRELLAETTGLLAGTPDVDQPRTEARHIIEEASGLAGAEWVLGLDGPATRRGVAHLDAMVDRRRSGEPLQYVLGRWGFRTLDLLCDPRALIPRPETEQVVEVALVELDRLVAARPEGHRPVVVDLGTGTGAIALSIAVERPGAEVWGTERSGEALAVARANLAGLGMAGAAVRLVEGSWFDPLPSQVGGAVDLVVTNPPYIGADEELPVSVADWEPIAALVAGAAGLEAYELVVAESARWLAPGGAFVAEVGATQAAAVLELCAGAGLVEARVHRDHAGLDRVVRACRPPSVPF
ncbi:peptide chain release factor N(5)-glutamine methyltransferase [soil metagenome]